MSDRVRFLLDTNICIHIIKGQRLDVISRFKRYQVSEIGISTISIAELDFGIWKSSKPGRNREALNTFLLPLEIVPFDFESALAYGEIRNSLEKRGEPIGQLDFLIAAQAIAKGLTIITNNTSEFSRVPMLKFEDWCAPKKGA